MGKQELVEFIAAKAGLTKADATRALDAALEGITTGLKKEGKVAEAQALFEKIGAMNKDNQGGSASEVTEDAAVLVKK